MRTLHTPFLSAILFTNLPNVLASRPCAGASSIAPIKWTVSEFTYDAPDKSARGRYAVDAIVGLYLSDYSCYAQWPETWAGRSAREDPQENSTQPLIWFPCINSRGRSVDETVSFALDWKTGELHVANMYICADGPNQGSPTTASASIHLNTTCDTTSPIRCITTDRFFDLNTIPDTTTPSTSGTPCSATSTQSPSWKITNYTPLYYALDANSPPTTTNDVLFQVKYLTGNTTYECRQIGTPSGTVKGSCTVAGATGGVTFQFDPVYKFLTLAQIPECAGTAIDVKIKGAGALPEWVCNNPDRNCALDDFWIGGEVV